MFDMALGIINKMYQAIFFSLFDDFPRLFPGYFPPQFPVDHIFSHFIKFHADLCGVFAWPLSQPGDHAA